MPPKWVVRRFTAWHPNIPTSEMLRRVAVLLRNEGRCTAKWRAHPDVVAFAGSQGMTVQELMDELERAET